MPLAKHIDSEALLQHLKSRPAQKGAQLHPEASHSTSSHHTPNFTYNSQYQSSTPIPKFSIPDNGTEGPVVKQLLKDELDLDGKPNLNLASFVHTYMEPSADELMMENIGKNLADADEYPAIQNLHARCISMLANLWNVQKGETAVGTATTGSSEGIHLGGLAMKKRWQEKRRKEGKSTEKPNILMGANAQVALEKFARYFEVEARIIPVSKESNYCLGADKIKENIDENTIGVFVILGSTYTGHYEPVEEISKVLDEYEKETGIDIPIHVDAASGGFVAPFVAEHTVWDFRIPRVKSIQTSGHKYGLVYAGLGWVVWRDSQYLPKDLIFELHYLGGTEQSYTLNFSRPAAHVVGQYFNFLCLGKSGYRSVMSNCLLNARTLSTALEASGWYHCVSSIHHPNPETSSSPDTDPEHYIPGLPVVAFHFSETFCKDFPHVKQQSVSTLLRTRGYIIPNYALPPNEENQEILRVVVRESHTSSLVDDLVKDILDVTEVLMSSDEMDLEAFAAQARGGGSVEKILASLGERHGHKKDKDGKHGKKGHQWGGEGAVLKATC